MAPSPMTRCSRCPSSRPWCAYRSEIAEQSHALLDVAPLGVGELRWRCCGGRQRGVNSGLERERNSVESGTESPAHRGIERRRGVQLEGIAGKVVEPVLVAEAQQLQPPVGGTGQRTGKPLHPILIEVPAADRLLDARV